MSKTNARAWSIVGPKGAIRLVRMTADAAKAAAAVVVDRGFPYKSWKGLYAQGYRCVPCVVTLERNTND